MKKRETFNPDASWSGFFDEIEIPSQNVIENDEELIDAYEALDVWEDMLRTAISKGDKNDEHSCRQHIQEIKISIRNYKSLVKMNAMKGAAVA